MILSRTHPNPNLSKNMIVSFLIARFTSVNNPTSFQSIETSVSIFLQLVLISHSAEFKIAAILLGFFDPLFVYRHRQRISLALVRPDGCGHSGSPNPIENYNYNLSISYPFGSQSN